MSDSFLAAVAIREGDATPVLAGQPVAPPLPSHLSVSTTPERGRSLVLARPAVAGETLLAEAPVCWWVDAERHEEVCARCLGVMALGGHSCCEVCRQACYCSAACRDEDASRHAGVCGTLAAATHADRGKALDAEAMNLLHFVAHALALHKAQPRAYAHLMGLHSAGVVLDAEERTACRAVAARLVAVAGAPPEGSWPSFVEALCRKDKASNFALTFPPEDDEEEDDDDDDDDDDEEEEDEEDDDDDDDDDEHWHGKLAGEGYAARKVRGYGCYPALALANHSCLPTVARFDHLDSPTLPPPPAHVCVGSLADAVAAAGGGMADGGGGDGGAAVRPPQSLATRYVALHALPAGSELHISYMPLGDAYEQRAERLQSEYCFVCGCARCVVEAADAADAPPAANTGDIDVTYVNLFVLKHTCAQCLGTMAPEAPVAVEGNGGLHPSSSCVCNRCGATRTEEEFVQQVQEHFAGDDDD